MRIRVYVDDCDGRLSWFDPQHTIQDWNDCKPFNIEDNYGRPVSVVQVLSLLPDQRWLIWYDRSDSRDHQGRLLSLSEAIDWLLERDFELPAYVAESLSAQTIHHDVRMAENGSMLRELSGHIDGLASLQQQLRDAVGSKNSAEL